MEIKSHAPYFKQGLESFEGMAADIKKTLLAECETDLECMAFFCGFITGAISVCAENHGINNAQTVLSNVSSGLARAQQRSRLKALQGASGNEPN